MGRSGTTFTRTLVKLGGQNRIDLLDQDRYWANQHGDIKQVEKMTPDHRVNLYHYLINNAWRLHRCAEEMLQEQWQGAENPPTLAEVSPTEWMMSRPLLKKLEQLIAADEAAASTA